MIHPKSLQQRLAVFVLLPVALLLIGMGSAGFIYSRNSMLAQWRETAILKLQRAAHRVDMRLDRIKKWIGALDEAGESQDPELVYSWIVDQLKKAEGVSRVNLTWTNDKAETMEVPKNYGHMGKIRARRCLPPWWTHEDISQAGKRGSERVSHRGNRRCTVVIASEYL